MQRPICVLVLLLVATACFPRRWDERHLHAPAQAPSAADAKGFLKVHLRSGEMIVLGDWRESEAGLFGGGDLYDLQRRRVRSDEFYIPIDSIALLESSVERTSRPAGPTIMATFTTIWTGLTIACVADPKSCFGSCPTFYVSGDTAEVPAAEGFSSSIARVLEGRDLDALYHARSTGDRFTVRMRNEALETHAVRRVRLLAVPRDRDARVFASPDGRFFPSRTIAAPTRCDAAEGDCLTAVAAVDGFERRSRADSTDLATTETLQLEFPHAAGSLGLVLGARHSLLSTFLFYETMGYLGTRAGEFLARLERMTPDAASATMEMARLVGRIEVEHLEHGAWQPIGTHDEAGPLATDVAVLPFARGHDSGPVRIRLRMTRGAWRLGYVALAQLDSAVTPDVLDPTKLVRDDTADPRALATLVDPDRHLVTYPGDEYEMEFRLPAGGDVELFLESEGYYYEWMRHEWLADEDASMAALVLTNPREGLRALAPVYHRAEPRMERLFWSSRFGR